MRLGHDRFMTLQVLVATDLPKPIRIGAEVLGSSLAAEIDGRAVTILTPKLTWDWMRFPKLEAPDEFVGTPADAYPVQGRNSEWGYALGFNPTDQTVDSVELQQVGIGIVESSLDGLQVLEERTFVLNGWLNHKLPPWFLAVSDWIEIWTEQVGSSQARNHRMPSFGHGIATWIRKGEVWEGPIRTLEQSAAVPLADSIWGLPADLTQLQRAVDLVSRAVLPDAEDLLRRDAREAWVAGQYRKATLDAGLASELVLYDKYQQILANPSSAAERKMPQCTRPTLGNLISALNAAQVALPNDLENRLLKTRNDATHKSSQISEQRASEALVATGEIFRGFGRI